MWLELVEQVDHSDYQRQAVVAVTVTPAVVHFLRAPQIRATVKQVRYEPLVTVANNHTTLKWEQINKNKLKLLEIK